MTSGVMSPAWTGYLLRIIDGAYTDFEALVRTAGHQ